MVGLPIRRAWIPDSAPIHHMTGRWRAQRNGGNDRKAWAMAV